jgi:hypothetical protein
VRMPATVLSLLGVLLAVMAAACRAPATPAADSLATAVAQAASDLLTQTAKAASPTPPPTTTLTRGPTNTPTSTPTSTGPPKRPQVRNFAGCWFGPGPSYVLESNISQGKSVDLLGVGSVSGWYIVRNPYFHQPCWMQAADLIIFPGTDLSSVPVMTPPSR